MYGLEKDKILRYIELHSKLKNISTGTSLHEMMA